MTARDRLLKLVAASLLGFTSVTGAAAVAASPAGAAEVTYLCGKSTGYECMPDTGYTGQSVWGSYGPGHNCVSYVAYMLERNGSARPWEGRLGNGSDWDEHARAAGYTVDANPAIGSIAQWDGGSGHVAYVNEVTPEHILVTEDNYSGYSASRLIPRDSTEFREAEFLHIRDLPPPVADDVIWAVDGSTATTLWWGAPGAPLVHDPGGMPPEQFSADEEVTVGDFDGDGHHDLLLTDGPSTRIAWGDGRGGFPDDTPHDTPSAGRAMPVVVDLDGDGADEVFWYGPGPIGDEVWWGRPGQRRHDVGEALFDGHYLPAAGDFDGDGVGDVLLIGPGGRPDRAIWGASGSRLLLGLPLAPAHIAATAEPVVGDFDGDGRDDVLWTGNGTPSAPLWWGSVDRVPDKRSGAVASGARAQAGDLDGDGRVDLLVFGPDGPLSQVISVRDDRRFSPTTAPAPPARVSIAIVGDFGTAP